MTIHNTRVCRVTRGSRTARSARVRPRAGDLTHSRTRCDGIDLDTTIATQTAVWGCAACGRDPRTEFAPTFQAHRVEPDGVTETVGLCPSCHDIVHQMDGPDVIELMHALRPACPRCTAASTLIVIVDPPPGPIPPGVSSRAGTMIDRVPDFACGSCDHEW